MYIQQDMKQTSAKIINEQTSKKIVCALNPQS